MAANAQTLVRRFVLDTLLGLKADKASPTFTGTVTISTLKLSGGAVAGRFLKASASDGTTQWVPGPVISDVASAFVPSTVYISQLFLYETDTKRLKLADGVTQYQNLVAINAPGAWDTEMVLNGGALASGYNDVGGGVQVNNPYSANGIMLESIAFRLGGDPDASPVVTGSGDLTIQYYLGSPTANTTLVATATVAAGGHDVVTVLAPSIQCAHGSVLRAKITLGSTGVAVPCHVQFRGRYV